MSGKERRKNKRGVREGERRGQKRENKLRDMIKGKCNKGDRKTRNNNMDLTKASDLVHYTVHHTAN